MKTQEQALTEWTANEIFMSFDKEDTGIRTCYTREAFVKFCDQHYISFWGCEPDGVADIIRTLGEQIGKSFGELGISDEDIRRWAKNFFSPMKMILYEKFDEIVEALKGQDTLVGFLSAKSGPRR